MEHSVDDARYARGVARLAEPGNDANEEITLMGDLERLVSAKIPLEGSDALLSSEECVLLLADR
jgi:hypothetical protein